MDPDRCGSDGAIRKGTKMHTTEPVHPSPWHGLFDRLRPRPGERDSPEEGSAESTLASAVYTDPARLGAEIEHLFRREPLCIGHADQLAEPGTVLARDVAGLPLLLMRDTDGSIGVFLNACRHRGARLVTEDGVACRRSTLSCLYHGWTYNLGGALVAVPRRDAFPTLDIATRGLRRLRSSVRHGLIWVVLDLAARDAPDIGTYLGDIDTDLAALGLGRHRFFRQHAVERATNWKLIMDAFVEVYHVKRLHASTIGTFFVDSRSVTDHVGPHQRMLVARDGYQEMYNLPPEQWSPREHGTLVHLIFPNTIIVYHPDYVSLMGMFPLAVDRTLFVHTMLTPEAPRDEKAVSHWDRSFDLIDRQVFNAEDLFICEQIQRGLVAAAGDDLLLGRFETNVRRFHDAVAAAIA
jgi:Rieske 2Fe-2S family protein